MANDFRGYVQSQNPSYLGVIGNDYTIGGSTGVNKAKLLQQVGNSQGLYNSIIQNLDNLYKGYQTQSSGGGGGGRGGGGYNASVYAPTPNFAAINATARSQAEAAVNPVYTKYLNDFLAQQGQQKQIRQQMQDLSIKNAEQTLAQQLEQNKVTGQRTTEDTATNLANINTSADQYQTDTGQKFATDRLAQAKSVAQAGLTGGLGAQQGEAIQTARNTEEERQGVQVQQQKDQQELSKVRTFQDLEQSGRFATQKKESGVQEAKLSLADFIAGQGIELQNKQTALEQDRQAELARTQAAVTKQQYQAFFNSISNPAQKAAFASAYGSYL